MYSSQVQSFGDYSPFSVVSTCNQHSSEPGDEDAALEDASKTISFTRLVF